MLRIARLVLCTAALLVAAPAVARAQLPPLPGQGPKPEPFRANDGGGFHDILPSGTRGLYDAADLGAFLATGRTVPHCCDQLPMYATCCTPRRACGAQDIPKYFKDSSFGVPAGEAERTYSPALGRDDRARQGVRRPARLRTHARGRDVRARLRRRRGPAVLHGRAAPRRPRRAGELRRRRATRRWTREQWAVAPYTEADLQRQARDLPAELGAAGRADQARRRPTTSPASTSTSPRRSSTRRRCRASTRRSASRRGPTPFTEADLIATASLVGGIFGKGGGAGAGGLPARGRAREALRPQARRPRAAATSAPPTTPRRRSRCSSKRFPYEVPPRHVARGSVARPDRGSLRYTNPVAGRGGRELPLSRLAGRRTAALPADGLQRAARLGAQVGQRAPADRRRAAGRLLQPADPDGGGRPRARLLRRAGHRRRAARRSSASTSTSSSAAGATTRGARRRPARTSSTRSRSADLRRRRPHYRYRGRCQPIEVLQRTDTLDAERRPTRPRPAAQTLRAERTKLGLVAGRGTIRGKPVVFTELRSTYFHEVDSAAGFMDFNDPSAVHDPRELPARRGEDRLHVQLVLHRLQAHRVLQLRATTRCGPRGVNSTSRSGARRSSSGAAGTRTTWTARFTPPAAHPQAVDQSYLINWNNKQARGYRGRRRERVLLDVPLACCSSDRIKRRIRGRAQDDAAGADRRDGGRRAPATCARTSTCRWR